MEANVVYSKDVAAKDLGGGVTRRVLAHSQQLMIVEVNFEAGSIGSVHTHPHCQNTYVGGSASPSTARPWRWAPATPSPSPPGFPTAPCAWRRARCWTCSPPCGRIFWDDPGRPDD